MEWAVAGSVPDSPILTTKEKILVDGLVRLLRSGDRMTDVATSALKYWMEDNPPVKLQAKQRKAG
jgi:hypothetical protein